ncbi:MAG: hypothetical protein EA398_01250 [Deltaproteobacteria bacterium]|nr:MAG: hypothetical protein EA398_01250 [Deltaproteobacteria bacterium]
MLLMLVLAVSFGWVGCGSDSGETRDRRNPPSAHMEGFNAHAAASQDRLRQMAALASGEGGYLELARRLRTMPLDTREDVLAFLEAHQAYNDVIAELVPLASAHALHVQEMAAARQAFLEEAAAGFPWPPDEEEAKAGMCGVSPLVTVGGLEDPEVRPFLLTSLAVGTVAIAGYRMVRGASNLMNSGQRIVGRTAERSPEGAAAVRRALEDMGVDVPAGADGEALTALFERQPMRTRIRVTSEVNGWVADEIMSGSAVGDDATELAVQSREDIPEIANEAGAYAVEQTVNVLQLPHPGAGELLFGVPGAVADFTLFALEMTPTDVIRRNATVYVQSQDRVPLPSTTSTTPAPVAQQVVRQAAAQDPSVDLDALADAADALIRDAAATLRQQFGPAVQIAQRIASLDMTLEDTELGSTTEVYQEASTTLPGFANDEPTDVLIVQPNIVPQEEPGHVLSPENPIELETPPLRGTLSARGTATGPADSLGTQPFQVDFDVRRVRESVTVACRGVNATCQPATVTLRGEGSGSFGVQVSGQGQVRLVRMDSGEAYLLALRGGTAPPPQNGMSEACRDAQDHLCSRLPSVGCDISVMDTARERVIAACGSAEANRFFARAPAMCC